MRSTGKSYHIPAKLTPNPPRITKPRRKSILECMTEFILKFAHERISHQLALSALLFLLPSNLNQLEVQLIALVIYHYLTLTVESF
jgi:hypothetical protein